MDPSGWQNVVASPDRVHRQWCGGKGGGGGVVVEV